MDQNGDGRLDASFGVFDKYGSVVTPSGDISSAKSMTPAAINEIDPHDFPANYMLSFMLVGKRTQDGARLRVFLDKEGHSPGNEFVSRGTSSNLEKVNISVKINYIKDENAEIVVSTDNGIGIVGYSGDVFIPSKVP